MHISMAQVMLDYTDVIFFIRQLETATVPEPVDRKGNACLFPGLVSILRTVETVSGPFRSTAKT